MTVDLADGPRQVTGRAAQGQKRERLGARWHEIDENLDAYAARRSMETAVVVLEPRERLPLLSWLGTSAGAHAYRDLAAELHRVGVAA